MAGDIETALAQFIAAWESGARPDPEEYCKNFGDGSEQLREAIGDYVSIFGGAHERHGGASSASVPLNKRLGDFELISEIGRGGMGVVYEAEQRSLHRRVALKVLSPQCSLDRAEVERFAREAVTTARLRHANIVEIYAVGEADGVQYFSMELVHGVPLHEWQPPSMDAICRVGVEIARALAHAHAAGVVHRDVKPSNILIASDGRALLTDFGLARDAGLESLTRTGKFLGTPHYVSPEQAAGSAAIDHRADIYSLGVTLYEILTGHRPFEGRTAHEILARVLTQEPPPPQKFDPTIPPDLATILLKALEKSPERRYTTADALGDDLQSYREGRPISARPVSTATRMWRWAIREPTKAALAAIIGLGVPTCAAALAYGGPKLLAMRAAERDAQVEATLVDGFMTFAVDADSDQVAAFERVLRLEPGHPEAIAGLALARLRNNAPRDVLSLLDRESAARRDHRAWRRIRAEALDALGRKTEADQVREGVGEATDPLEYFVAGWFATRAAHAGEPTAAKRAVDLHSRAILLSPRPRPAFYFELAFVAGLANDVATVERVCEALPRLWPDVAGAHYWAGHAMRRHDPARAVVHYENAVRLAPTSHQYSSSLAGIYHSLRDYPRALVAHRKTIELAPNLSIAHAQLGITLTEMGRYEEALDSLRKAVKIDPREPQGMIQLGVVLRALGESREAVKVLRQAVQIPFVLRDRAPIQLACAAMETGEFGEAVATLQTIESRYPKSEVIARLLGHALDGCGDTVKAIASYRRAIAIDERSAAHAQLCSALERAGLATECEAELARWNALAKENPRPWLNIAWASIGPEDPAHLRDLDRAQWYAQRALEITESSDPEPLIALAAISLQRGSYEESVDFASRASQLMREDTTPALRALLARWKARIEHALPQDSPVR